MGRKKAVVEAGPNDHVARLYDGDDISNIRYGSWKEAKDGNILIPAYLGGSDYSGSLVERANADKWAEMFADGDDVWWSRVIGGHGTFQIIVDMEKVPDDISEEVAETLNALNDYPLIDEEKHSEMEMEAQEEAWNNWAEKDFARELEKKFGVDIDRSDDEKLKKLREVFEEAREAANEYWSNQQGDEMYIDLKRIAAKVPKKALEELVEDQLPLL